MTTEKDPIWEHIDRHTKELSELAERHAALHERQIATDERMDRMLVMMSEHRTESRTEIGNLSIKLDTETTKLSKKLDTVHDAVIERRGGIKTAGWIIGTLLALAAVVISAIALFT